MNLILKIVIGILSIVTADASTCPCHDESLCQPLTVKYEKEILGFATNGEKDLNLYDWDKLTTIAIFGEWSDKVLCLAHEKQVRVVLHAPVSNNQLANETYKKQWILDQLSSVKEHHADGINFDLESPIEKDSKEYFGYTELVKSTTEAMHKAIPGSQVTVDVAWAPGCIDGRCYDYVNLAKYSDFLVVMAYDEQSQMYDKICHAKPNSGIEKTAQGIEEYLKLDIEQTKLIIGLPWYGYDYPCIEVTQENMCKIKQVPFRGANCSDAAGRQYCYPDIAYNFFPFSVTPLNYDKTSQSKYFNYKKEDGVIHQVWYDDPVTLKIKYDFIVEKGLKGIAIWNIDCALNSDFYGEEMWKALPSIKQYNKVVVV